MTEEAERRGLYPMLVLMVVCALFAVPILLGLVVIGAELAWAILALPFRLLAWSWRACESAAHWIARRYWGFR